MQSHEPLTEAEWERALAWATRRVSEGHHYRCNVNRGEPCDCYFRSGLYQAARLIVSQAKP
jgi:hypothetical protein